MYAQNQALQGEYIYSNDMNDKVPTSDRDMNLYAFLTGKEKVTTGQSSMKKSQQVQYCHFFRETDATKKMTQRDTVDVKLSFQPDDLDLISMHSDISRVTNANAGNPYEVNLSIQSDKFYQLKQRDAQKSKKLETSGRRKNKDRQSDRKPSVDKNAINNSPPKKKNKYNLEDVMLVELMEMETKSQSNKSQQEGSNKRAQQQQILEQPQLRHQDIQIELEDGDRNKKLKRVPLDIEAAKQKQLTKEKKSMEQRERDDSRDLENHQKQLSDRQILSAID